MPYDFVRQNITFVPHPRWQYNPSFPVIELLQINNAVYFSLTLTQL